MTRTAFSVFACVLALSACKPKSEISSVPPEGSEATCYIAYGEDHYTGVALSIAKVGIYVGTLKNYLQNYSAGRYDIRKLDVGSNKLMGEMTVTLTEDGQSFDQVWTMTDDKISFIRQGWASGEAERIDCDEMNKLFDELANETFEPTDFDFDGEVPG